MIVFKEGDKVRLNEDNIHYFNDGGKVYTVRREEYVKNLNETFVHLSGVHGYGGCFKYRLELAFSDYDPNQEPEDDCL